MTLAGKLLLAVPGTHRGDPGGIVGGGEPCRIKALGRNVNYCR